MALTASLIITGIAIGLLVLYGADVASSINIDGEVGEKRDGFLPLDDMQRGMGLGAPALILPIIGFFISLKKPSKGRVENISSTPSPSRSAKFMLATVASSGSVRCSIVVNPSSQGIFSGGPTQPDNDVTKNISNTR